MHQVFASGFLRAADPRPVAVVLSGGGNLGAAQVGMLRALLEHGIVPDLWWVARLEPSTVPRWRPTRPWRATTG
jgi:hypothetical protein